MVKRKKTELTAELIALAKAGDSKAKNQLFTWITEFIRPIINVSPHRTHDRRSDISQDVAVNIINGLKSCTCITPGDFEKWVSCITRHAIAESIRYAGRDKRDINKGLCIEEFSPEGVVGEQKSPSRMFADEETVQIILRILWDDEKLDASRREVIVLRLLYKFPVAVVARRMGTTAAAIDSRFRRALENLQQLYAAETGGTPRKTTTAARDKRATVFLEYVRRCDAGKTVDIGAFLIEFAMEMDDELRTLLEMIEKLREFNLKDDEDT